MLPRSKGVQRDIQSHVLSGGDRREGDRRPQQHSWRSKKVNFPSSLFFFHFLNLNSASYNILHITNALSLNGFTIPSSGDN